MYKPFVWVGGNRYQSKGRFHTYSDAVQWVKRMCDILGTDTFGGALKGAKDRFKASVLPEAVAG